VVLVGLRRLTAPALRVPSHAAACQHAHQGRRVQAERSSGGPRDLVPLDVLQAASRIPRDPVDEQFLRKLSKSKTGSRDVPRSFAGSPHQRLGAPILDGEDIKPRIPLQAEW
ncbi:hypothetical protein EVJ58_g10529, partial [Rhodofomes roseus]